MKDKKIAIITLHSVKNYGSILQTYATQHYFEEMGLDSVIIDFRRAWETKVGYWFYIGDKTLKGIARNVMYFPSKILQLFQFSKFMNNYLKLTPKTYTCLEDFKKYPIKVDYFCTGSDQVWNSGWNNGVIQEYFLNFADENSKKISFAASFGNSNITNDEAITIKPLIDSYDLITVREESSVEMLEKTFNLVSYEILDPTLQMDDIFWKSLCSTDRFISNKYVLLIQLNRNHEFDRLATNFTIDRGLKLVRLCLRVDQILLPGKHIIIPKVNDYIRLIRDAEYVLTDSFHAVSFCLNLEKQFYVYYPEKYSERLKSILSIMSLNDRELLNNNFNTKVNYSRIREILNKKREFSRKLFKEIIDEG